MGETTTTLEIHPLALLFPALSDADFERLKVSISTVGQQEPIWTVDGKVIDGRHRLAACQDLGLEPIVEERDVPEGADLVDLVLAVNADRRHLSESQRAMVAARLVRGGLLQICSTAKPPGIRDLAEAAARRMLVGSRSVFHALAVLDGVGELAEAVERGEASVSAAAAAAKLPPREQRKAAEGGRRGVAEAAKRAKSKAGPPPPPAPWTCSDCSATVPLSESSAHECPGDVEDVQVAADVEPDPRDDDELDRLDADGWAIPDDLLAAWLHCREAGPDVARAFEAAAQRVRRLVEEASALNRAAGRTVTPGRTLRALVSAAERAQQAAAVARRLVPFVVHRACDGDGCPDCDGAGWLDLPGLRAEAARAERAVAGEA